MDELAAGRLVSFDSRHRRKDGSTFPVEIRLRPFSMNGKRYAIALVRDITSRKQAETALKESEARMKAAQRFAGLGVWQWDLGEKVWWSEELYNIYGRDPASFTPSYENFLSHIPADEHEKIIAALQKSMWSGSPYEHEYHIVRADGQLRTVRTEGVVDLDESGKPARMWGICRDITESKLAEEAIRRSEEIVNQHRMEVAHLSRVASLGEMASSLAHELNQPLTAILGYAGVCMDAARAHNGMASAKQMAEHLEELCKEARRAAEIIQRLRAHIRKQALHRSLQDVRAHMQEAVDLMRFELRRAGVKPEFQFSRNLSRVRVDSVQIQQVMINLIQNALDAMEDLKAADRKLVLKAAKADKGSVRVSVVDAGTGVPKEMSGRIFESFFTTKQDGLGLGLPICRSIIESHGGRLSATPNADRGMTFEFVLPAAGRT
jgi:signal transduction histidine kinase